MKRYKIGKQKIPDGFQYRLFNLEEIINTLLSIAVFSDIIHNHNLYNYCLCSTSYFATTFISRISIQPTEASTGAEKTSRPRSDC